MTTIDEENMDEFFNFEDAANPLDPNDIDDISNLESFPCDLDLEFPGGNDGNLFTYLEHFSPAEDQLFGNQHNAAMTDTTMMGPDAFADFPRWIDGMDVPTDPCAYCRRLRLHCKIIKEGLRKGSCTSCVALARSCSLTHPGPQPVKKNRQQSSPSFGFPANTVDPEECQDCDECIDQITERCEHCSHAGFECLIIKEGDNAGSCTNCVAFTEPCSFKRFNDGMSGMLPLEPSDSLSRCASGSNLTSLKSSDENMNATLTGGAAPKVGARFSRESLRILRNWLNTHSNHPYPTDEEKETLRRQTGLNKTQITNWLANARRRGKVRPPRSTSPAPRGYSNAMDIPRRPGTPGIENMNPMERWKNSPPEHEPASVTAIAKAVTSSSFASGMDSPYTSYGHSDDGSNKSLCNVSSTSSLGTSHSSGGSFASAFSHKSRGSFGSFGSFGNRGRRRRRRQAPKPVKVDSMSTPARTFQCTFCTETFKTKHDWQRHEKSLHLSLERWVCCPSGPTQFSADDNHNRCVFCGLPNPPADHAEVHNYSSCADRNLEERTFYRKDHLRQHLNLVHDAKFQAFSMETWKVSTPEIRSRCGFCGIVMDSWSIRVDHLADHFKGGKSMADWKGDWGFEAPILDLVENGMPPYLIHDERNSMSPFEASKESGEKTKTSYDTIKFGLVEYIQEQVLRGGAPTDDDLLREARNIIAKDDELTDTFAAWFRDLLILYGIPEDDELAFPEPSLPCYKRLEVIAAAQANHTPSDLAAPSYNCDGKLGAFVYSKQMLGLTPTDRELQVECCTILDDLEKSSLYPCKGAVDWFKYLITSETCWLREFRKRCGLPRSSEIAFEHIRSSDDKSIDYSIHNFSRLENELKDWARFHIALGNPPTDADIQRQARLIVYKNDDPWNQTAVDDPAILHLFKRQTGLAPLDIQGVNSLDLPPLSEGSETGVVTQQHNAFEMPPKTLHWDLEQTSIGLLLPNNSTVSPSYISPTNRQLDQPLHTLIQNQPSTNTNPTQPLKYFLNDANCYGRLVRELTRFVTACMSPNNPNQHVPSDAEIQNQARWTIYDDDDPWNQTAADNAEWLIRFKRDVGLAPTSDGPGLPSDNNTWNPDLGGSGFAPPYINPKEPRALNIAEEQLVKVKVGDARYYSVKARTAKGFAGSMKGRWQQPGKIFCSRELEQGLGKYVTAEMGKGVVPSDEALKAKAKQILGLETTAADDAELLEKFKSLHGIPSSSPSSSNSNTTPTAQLEQELASIDSAMLADFDQELGNMDLSGLELPGTGVDHMDLLMDTQPSVTNNNAEASGSSEGVHGKGLMKEGVAPDYAEMYRVQAATASPLRRKASERMAEARGFRLPTIEGPFGKNQ